MGDLLVPLGPGAGQLALTLEVAVEPASPKASQEMTFTITVTSKAFAVATIADPGDGGNPRLSDESTITVVVLNP